MVTPRPIDPDFEPATHVALHRLPVAAFGEPLGRRGGDLGQHHAHGRPNLGRAGLEEVATQSALARVVVAWRRKKTTSCASSEEGPVRTAGTPAAGACASLSVAGQEP